MTLERVRVPERMRAVRFHRFGPVQELRIDEVSTPIPGPDEILLRVRACGINRYDVQLRRGEYGGISLEDFHYGEGVGSLLPHTLGIEPAGEVAALGAGVTGIAVGDRVLAHSHVSCGRCEQCWSGWDNACPQIQILGVHRPGGYAEYIVIPARNAIPLDANLSFEDAAATCVNFGTAWRMLIGRARLQAGEVLLVPGGTSGVGHASIQIGQLAGARVLATAGSPAKLARLREWGVTDAFDHNEGDFAAEVMRVTGGHGADVAVEFIGAATWERSVRSLALHGRLVCCGAHTGVDVHLNLGDLFARQYEVIGSTRANRAEMESVVGLVATRQLQPKIERRFRLDEMQEAHRLLERREQIGKFVLLP